MDLLGRTLGNYRVDRLLGEGGMGAVYQAYDLSLQREIAIKFIQPHYARRPKLRERFLQEARVMARLDHEGIVKVYTIGAEGDLLYIVMEFIPGGNLRQLLDGLLQKNQWLPLDEAIHLVEQLCHTLEYAHQNNVLHRDIKPANLMLKRESTEGLPFRVILTDLGLARLLEGQGLTQEGATLGTPAYMSPEQAAGRETDPRSDVYSLGILLYELAVGRLPFPIRSISEAVRYHTREAPPTPRSIRPELPETLERVILKALEKEPDRRYSSAAGLATILAGAMGISTEISDLSTGHDASLVKEFEQSLIVPARPQPPSRITMPDSEASVHPPTMLDERSFGPNPTVLDGGMIPARGSSLFAGKPVPAGAKPRLQVVHKERTAEVFPLQLGEVTVGRGPGADIILPDPKISQRHIKITWDGLEYHVMDLNSANGSYMGNTRLLAGFSETWRPNQDLRIGETWLRLIRPSMSLLAPIGSGQGHRLSSNSIFARSLGGLVSVAISPQQLEVEAGGSVSATISLINQSPNVDHLSLSLTGIPSNWILELPPQVELMPGAPKEIALILRVPRVSESRAGRHQMMLRVNSQRDASQFAEAKFTLVIAAYSQFKAELQPQRLRAGQAGKVTVTNSGNAQDTFTVTLLDDLEELSFQPPQFQIVVPEGQTITAEYRAQLRQLRWIGKEKSHAFNAQVSPPNGEPLTLRAEVLSRGWLPAWTLAIIIPFCLLLIGLPVTLMPPVQRLFATETGTPTATATFTPSATPRGQPVVEEWCIYPRDRVPPAFVDCPAAIEAVIGQTLIIRWRVSNADEVIIQPFGNQPPSGEIPYEVTQSTTGFILQASNNEASTQKQVQISLLAPSATPSATWTLTGTSTTTSTPTFTLTPTPTPYFNGFEGPERTGWSPNATAASPLNHRVFLGEFGGNQTVTLTLDNLPPHTSVKLSFDLYLIRSWDGNGGLPGNTNGPDFWMFAVQGIDPSPLLKTTFCNAAAGSATCRQAYPAPYDSGINYPPRFGAVENDSLGFQFDGQPMDSVYRLFFSFDHSASSLVLVFSSSGLQALTDETWGLDNVEVILK